MLDKNCWIKLAQNLFFGRNVIFLSNRHQLRLVVVRLLGVDVEQELDHVTESVQAEQLLALPDTLKQTSDFVRYVF
jgi:hypothetical protein